MNIGKLNKRLVLKYVSARVTDNQGGYTETVSTAKTTWGMLRPVSAREQLIYGLELGSRSYVCVLRYDATYKIDQNYYIEWTDRGSTTRTFRIVSVIDEDEGAKQMTLLINERTD
jgi:head-tail adaptor